MKKLLAVGLLVAMVPMAHAATSPAAARSRHHASLRSMAKVSADSARAIALAQVPGGTIASHELGREHGKLAYSFDVKVPGKSGFEEVKVDAKDGKVMSTRHETAAAERKERAKEQKKATATNKSTTGKSTP